MSFNSVQLDYFMQWCIDRMHTVPLIILVWLLNMLDKTLKYLKDSGKSFSKALSLHWL